MADCPGAHRVGESHPPKFEMVHRCDTLEAFDHARGNGREEQFCRIKSIRAATHIGIEYDLGVLAAGRAAMGIDAFCGNIVFEHGARRHQLICAAST